MIKDNSKNKAYYSQRNNEISPNAACNVTAMIQALVVAGWPLPKGKYKQPEDNLIDFIRHDDVVLKEWKRIDPKGSIPPNQWHTLLCQGVNRWLLSGGIVGKNVIELHWGFSISDFKALIDKGGAVVFSGRFKTRRGTIGHIVSGVGYECDNAGSITSIIIDDPWGDYRTKYVSHGGNSILMPVKDFINLIRRLKNPKKLAHVVPRFERG